MPSPAAPDRPVAPDAATSPAVLPIAGEKLRLDTDRSNVAGWVGKGALVYLITATADFSDTVTESAEGNNERQLFLTVASPTPAGVYVAGSSDVDITDTCPFLNEEISEVMARQVEITIAPNGDVMATVAGGALSGTGVLSGNSFSFSISTPIPFSTTNISGCTGSGTISGTLVATTITGTWSASGTCATACSAWSISLNQNYVATSAP